MSFSRDVRTHLAQLPVEKPCCRQSQLLAMTIAGASEAASYQGQPHVVFTVENAAVARHLFRLGKAQYGVAPVVETHVSPHAGRPTAYRVAIPVDAAGRMPASLTIDELQDAINRKPCCRRSFLRGVFMVCGSLVSPAKAYHLEWNAAEAVCEWIGELLKREKVTARCYQREPAATTWTVYVKDSQEITTFLGLIGAHQALLAYEDVRTGKDLVNSVQRQVNCETANLSRTLTSAARQVQELGFLHDGGHLAGLSPDCRAVAIARLEKPYASLVELGRELDPPLGKSAVNHRLRLLHQAFERVATPAERAALEQPREEGA